MLASKAELERGSCHLHDPILGELQGGTGVAYLPQVCPVLCQHCCFGPPEVVCPQHGLGALLGLLLQGSRFALPSLPACYRSPTPQRQD